MVSHIFMTTKFSFQQQANRNKKTTQRLNMYISIVWCSSATLLNGLILIMRFVAFVLFCFFFISVLWIVTGFVKARRNLTIYEFYLIKKNNNNKKYMLNWIKMEEKVRQRTRVTVAAIDGLLMFQFKTSNQMIYINVCIFSISFESCTSTHS